MSKIELLQEVLEFYNQLSLTSQAEDITNVIFDEGERAKEGLKLVVELREEMEWQPIETAPKDVLFLAWEDGKCWIAKLLYGTPKVMHFGKWVNIYPTHWKPFPHPPKGELSEDIIKDERAEWI